MLQLLSLLQKCFNAWNQHRKHLHVFWWRAYRIERLVQKRLVLYMTSGRMWSAFSQVSEVVIPRWELPLWMMNYLGQWRNMKMFLVLSLCTSVFPCVPPWLTRWSWTQECKKLVGPFHILLFIHQSHFDITQHCLPQRTISRLYNGRDLLSIKATFPPTILMSSMHRIESIFPPFGCMVSTYHRPTHSSPRFLLFTDS